MRVLAHMTKLRVLEQQANAHCHAPFRPRLPVWLPSCNVTSARHVNCGFWNSGHVPSDMCPERVEMILGRSKIVRIQFRVSPNDLKYDVTVQCTFEKSPAKVSDSLEYYVGIVSGRCPSPNHPITCRHASLILLKSGRNDFRMSVNRPDTPGTSPIALDWDVTVHCTFEKSPEKSPIVGNITSESFPVGVRVQTIRSHAVKHY